MNETAMMRKVMVVVVMMTVYGLGHQRIRVQAQVHHVVGEDPGWDVASDIASWASARTFAVGDFLWFAYSGGGINKDNVVELRTKQEFESCDVSNPIKLYSDGLDKIPLQEEGTRYFASSNPDNCKKGLKLPVEVKSRTMTTAMMRSIPSSEKDALAEEPTTPSSSNRISETVLMIIGGIVFSYITAIV